MLPPETHPYLYAALPIAIAFLLIYRYLLLYSLLGRRRMRAAHHHDWSQVRKLGQRQLDIRTGELDLTHD
ncbi:MAG: hypothetical protein ACYTGH_21780, partial [Planctomycetota bacterium]